MSAFLLTFKPDTENRERGWPIEKLRELIKKIELHGSALEPWRFSNRKDRRVGDRVFLVRQGTGRLSLLGYGRIQALPKNEKPIIEFQRMVDPTKEFLASGWELKAIPNSANHWKVGSSGTLLQPHVAAALELFAMDASESGADDGPGRKPNESEAEFMEGQRRLRFHKRMERQRNTALVAAVKSRLGCKCQACGFSFSTVYGRIGDGYIEAHHLEPLHRLKGDGPQRKDPIRDFAVLCANCHRVIHKMGCPSLDDFKRTLIASIGASGA